MTEFKADEALKRLLVDAGAGGQAKVDALVALSQRTLYVATWPATRDGFRTLVNSAGTAGLPVFSSSAELESAARRFGWMNPDGSLPLREIGAREAFSHALAHGLFIIVNIASDFALEVEPAEIGPLLSQKGGREGSGPYVAAGRISSSMLQASKAASATPGSLRTELTPGKTPSSQSIPAQAGGATRPSIEPPSSLPQGAIPAANPSVPVRQRTPTPMPGGMPSASPPGASAHGAGRPPSSPAVPLAGAGGRPPSSPAMPVAARPPSSPAIPLGSAAGAASSPPAAGGGAVSFGGASSVVFTPLTSSPTEELLHALNDFLKNYPEIEWACVGFVSRGPTAPVPTIGLRIDTSFRTRVNEIIKGVREAGSTAGASLDVMLIDDPTLMRQARSVAMMFYPWRRGMTRA